MLLSFEDVQLELQVRKSKIRDREIEIQKINDEITSLTANLKVLDTAVILTKKCIEKNLEQKQYIEVLESSALTEILDTPYTFILESVFDEVIKGLKPRISRGLDDADDPRDSEGAGVVTIISLCFKLSLLLLTKRTGRFLILDEVISNIHPSVQPRVQAFLEKICERTGLQIIMIIHSTADPFGRTYHASLSPGAKNQTYSIVKEINNAYSIAD